MSPVAPASAEELAGFLADAAAGSRTLSVLGNNSKHLMAGPMLPADQILSTVRLNRILDYEPNDLTVSVEAGARWADLQALLARKRQMIALDPPFHELATVGGVIASNSSGPLCRAFGTARDLVIGMQFATLEGKLVRAGGMVVKNVAGLDIGKLMIGSFGTLAAITSVNFRLHVVPEATETFVFSSNDLAEVIGKRDALLASVLRPLAIDVLSPSAAARLNRRGYQLAVRVGGSTRVLARYGAELSGGERIAGSDEAAFWAQIREFAADFMLRQPSGIVLRISTTLSELAGLLQLVSGPAISRAGSGTTQVYLSSSKALIPFLAAAAGYNWKFSVEYAPDDFRGTQIPQALVSMPSASTFAMMKKVKQMFDPRNLLNRSRLYGCL